MENNKKKTHEMKTHFILCLPTPGDTTDYDDQTAFVISLLRRIAVNCVHLPPAFVSFFNGVDDPVHFCFRAF